VVASRSIGASSYNLRSLFVSLLGFGFIVALFFIPEILNFKKGTTVKSSGIDGIKTFKTAQTSDAHQDPKSALTQMTALVDSGLLGKNPKESATEAGKKKGSAAGKVDVNKESPTLDSSKPTLNWRVFKSGQQRKAFRGAEKSLQSLAASISGDQRSSRLALLSLVSTIAKVSSSNVEKSFSARDALSAIERDYSNVINSFVSEGVEARFFKLFVGTDFGPLARDWSPKLAGVGIPFHPHLTLTALRLTNKSSKNSGQLDLSTSIDGYVLGEDVSRIEVVIGGVVLDDLKIKNTDKEGYRKFRLPNVELNGKVLFKVYDRSGRLFQKLYSLYPRARIFEDENGRFNIPKSAGNLDTRLDRFFTYQTSQDSATLESDTSAFESNGFERF
jgi:hypothetical protein